MQNNSPPTPPTPPTVTPLNKRVGRFYLIEKLGVGSTGTVFRGHDPVIDRDVAIKILNTATNATDKKQREQQFINEARAAGRLSHPSIVTIYDASSEGGTTFIAMEFLPGQDLRHLLSQGKTFDIIEMATIIQKIADALSVAHRSGVIHRDIKPGNIMVTRAGRAKLTDFGIARVDGGVLTQTGMLAGSAAYMSPEQFTGERVDERSDLWACGVLLFVMLTGKHPFAGSSFTETMKKIIDTEPPALSSWRALPPAFDTIVRRALAKNPAERFQSASRFAAALHTLDLSVDRGTTVASPIRP